jgi:hypothetical protein
MDGPFVSSIDPRYFQTDAVLEIVDPETRRGDVVVSAGAGFRAAHGYQSLKLNYGKCKPYAPASVASIAFAHAFRSRWVVSSHMAITSFTSGSLVLGL